MPKFRASECREADASGVFRLIGVLVVSGSRGEGKFLPAAGQMNRIEEHTARIDACLAAGRSVDDLIDYLFDRANGMTVSWSEPFAFTARDIGAAAHTALAIATRRDSRLSQADEGVS